MLGISARGLRRFIAPKLPQSRIGGPRVSRGELEQWLLDAGGVDPTRQHHAELRLSILPRTVVLEHLETLWRSEERIATLLRNSFYLLAGSLSGTLLLCGLWLCNTMNIVGLALALPGVLGLAYIPSWWRDLGLRHLRRRTGLYYLLLQHQSVDTAPLLVEALASASEMGRYSQIYTRRLREALSHLLPRHAAADVPALSGYQSGILWRELTAASRRLRNPLTPLPAPDASFIISLLVILRPKRRPARESRRLLGALQDLAQERMEESLEPAPRTLIREAARDTIVRLFG